MKILTKINVGFSLFLLVPLSVILSVAIYSYTTALDEEVQGKLAADLKIAELLLDSETEAFRQLAASYARRKSLSTLLKFDLPQKLERELEEIRQMDRLDELSVLPLQEARQKPIAAAALAAECARAGVELQGTELMLSAAAPVRDRDDTLFNVILIRKRLLDTGILDTTRRETGANLSLHVHVPEATGALKNAVSLPILDHQGNPLGFWLLQRRPDKWDVTARTLLHALWIAGICGIVAVVLLRVFVVRTIVRPVLALKQRADEIGTGNYHTRVLPSDHDEIGDLGRCFNAMAEQIQHSLEASQTLNETLEQRVADRTAELHERSIELEQTLQELDNTQVQLVARERLATLGQLMAGVAHEIKNPLHYIGSFSDLVNTLVGRLRKELAKETPDPEELDYLWEHLPLCAGKIKAHTLRANSTINRMLDQTRDAPGVPAPVKLNPLIRDYVRLAYKTRDLSLSLQEDYSPELDALEISAIPGDLGRAVLNLTLNACDEMARKTKTAGPGYRAELRVSTEGAGHEAVIRIRDNGDGIPEEWREKIFDAFFSGKPPGEGTGLGLSIAYDIITKIHRGSLEFESQAGEFSEFIIRLPK